MRVRRDISSVPFQSASETWRRIIDLVAGPDSIGIQQLKDATGVMSSIIADGHPAQRAILLEGVGPQLRIYCRYGMKAIEEGEAVDGLTWNPSAGDWAMHVPCDAENMDWVRESLSKTSPRISVFDVSSADRAEEKNEDNAEKAAPTGIIVDWDFKEIGRK